MNFRIAVVEFRLNCNVLQSFGVNGLSLFYGVTCVYSTCHRHHHRCYCCGDVALATGDGAVRA